jgi:hypothetical protein
MLRVARRLDYILALREVQHAAVLALLRASRWSTL